MNRRHFLGLVPVVAVGLLFDPERLLWVPGAKTILLPPTTVFRGQNAFVTADWVSREALRILEHQLAFSPPYWRVTEGGVNETDTEDGRSV